jgi:hypothetical protein
VSPNVIENQGVAVVQLNLKIQLYLNQAFNIVQNIIAFYIHFNAASFSINPRLTQVLLDRFLYIAIHDSIICSRSEYKCNIEITAMRAK